MDGEITGQVIRKVTVRNFKRFTEQTFELKDSVVLAGPNNAGKSTLLQSLAAWKFGLERWMSQQSAASGSSRKKRTGVAVTRDNFICVPLREMNLLWRDRRVTDGPGKPRRIEIVVEGNAGGEAGGNASGEEWECGFEFEYANSEMVYVRPLDAKNLSGDVLRDFPPEPARNLGIVHVPPLMGIEREEPRHDRGMQDLLVGQGKPGEILRNLLLEIAESGEEDWNDLAQHIQNLCGIELLKPTYSPAQPYIHSEYKESDVPRALDLSSAGSGTLQVLLLLAFLYARPAAVILLDEPDAHQHIIWQKQVYDLIRKVVRRRGGQVIVATHSEVLFEATEPERVLAFIGDAPRALTSKSERDRVREALKRVSTTDLLLGREVGAVLYLEGGTDEKILAEWARILDHPAQSFFDRPFVCRLGGRLPKEAKGHFFALRAVFPELRGVCILDGDNRDEPDKKPENEGLVVLRWRRYEIENYLLVLDAIKRFVNFPSQDAQIEKEFWKQVPEGTDLSRDHDWLTHVKASRAFLLPLFEKLGKDVPQKALYQLAAEMQADEIHPEVVEKLDCIAEAFPCSLP